MAPSALAHFPLTIHYSAHTRAILIHRTLISNDNPYNGTTLKTLAKCVACPICVVDLLRPCRDNMAGSVRRRRDFGRRRRRGGVW
jgi:hypothetical protein